MNDKLERLTKLADELTTAEATVATKMEELREANAAVQRLTEDVIPSLMDELQLAKFTTQSGFTLEVGDKMFGKQLTHVHVAALDWLRKNDQGGLIKTTVTVPFPKGSEADADAIVDRLAGEGMAATKGVVVNAASLKAAVSRMMKEGVDVPMDTLSVHEKRIVTVKGRKR